jgi:hypothetical protein
MQHKKNKNKGHGMAKHHSCLQLQLCGTTFRTISELKTVSTTLKV